MVYTDHQENYGIMKGHQNLTQQTKHPCTSRICHEVLTLILGLSMKQKA